MRPPVQLNILPNAECVEDGRWVSGVWESTRDAFMMSTHGNANKLVLAERAVVPETRGGTATRNIVARNAWRQALAYIGYLR